MLLTFLKTKKSSLIGFLFGILVLVAAISSLISQRQLPAGLLSKFSPEKLLSRLTLEQKVGQMLIVGFWGSEPDYYINKMLDQRNIGGIFLTTYNIKDRDQTTALVELLQKRSLDTNPGIPLFIAVDQEGGSVSRVKVDGVEELTGQRDITTSDQAYDVARRRAEELKILGINMNFSPVLDFVSNDKSFLYGRTFRGSLSDISDFGSAMMRGYTDGGIIAVPKHFPGYTDEALDPHDEQMPTSSIVAQDLLGDQGRLTPFRSLIASKDSPKLLMVSPIIYESIDPTEPAIFSEIFLSRILRGKDSVAGYSGLGYQGLVITDDMEMKSMGGYDNAEAAVKAVQAGNDILLYTSTPEKQAEAYNAIIAAVRDGRISEQRIDQSVLAILRLKKEVFGRGSALGITGMAVGILLAGCCLWRYRSVRNHNLIVL